MFKGVKPEEEPTSDGFIIDYFKDYEVNVILDNSETNECPVIIETSPNYVNLFGTIEKINDGKWSRSLLKLWLAVDGMMEGDKFKFLITKYQTNSNDQNSKSKNPNSAIPNPKWGNRLLPPLVFFEKS